METLTKDFYRALSGWKVFNDMPSTITHSPSTDNTWVKTRCLGTVKTVNLRSKSGEISLDTKLYKFISDDTLIFRGGFIKVSMGNTEGYLLVQPCVVSVEGLFTNGLPTLRNKNYISWGKGGHQHSSERYCTGSTSMSDYSGVEDLSLKYKMILNQLLATANPNDSTFNSLNSIIYGKIPEFLKKYVYFEYKTRNVAPRGCEYVKSLELSEKVFKGLMAPWFTFEGDLTGGVVDNGEIYYGVSNMLTEDVISNMGNTSFTIETPFLQTMRSRNKQIIIEI